MESSGALRINVTGILQGEGSCVQGGYALYPEGYSISGENTMSAAFSVTAGSSLLGSLLIAFAMI